MLAYTNRPKKKVYRMPLLLAEVGESNLIRHIGGTPEIKCHLEALGFADGTGVIISSRGHLCLRTGRAYCSKTERKVVKKVKLLTAHGLKAAGGCV